MYRRQNGTREMGDGRWECDPMILARSTYTCLYVVNDGRKCRLRAGPSADHYVRCALNGSFGFGCRRRGMSAKKDDPLVSNWNVECEKMRDEDRSRPSES